MGLPSITIEFIKKAVAATEVGSGGIVGMILSDSVNLGAIILKDVSEIPTNFTQANQKYIERAFWGSPKKIIAYTFGTVTNYSYTEAEPDTGDNPSTKGWFEHDNDAGTYALSTDTVVNTSKTYYTIAATEHTADGTENPSTNDWYTLSDGVYTKSTASACNEGDVFYTILATTVTSPDTGDNPHAKGWYELNSSTGEYSVSEDTRVNTSKTYYIRSSTTVTTTLADAMKYFKSTKVNFLCGMPDISGEQATQLATWCKSVRSDTPNRPIVVVPNVNADYKGVVNFSVTGGTAGTAKIEVDDTQYTEAEYCSRIAGLLAGLPYTVSATYKPLKEITSIPEVDPDDVDAAIDAGKLTLYNTGEDIVIARGVTSLTTVTQDDTEDLKKIKIVCIQDLIEGDIYRTINSTYIGNYTNSYDNKCLLVTAIRAYLKKLDTGAGGAGYISENHSMDIDVANQRTYLESKGIDTSDMSEQDIKQANTDSWVFLVGTVSILDAIEDVKIRINKV